MEDVSKAQETIFLLVEPATLKGGKRESFYTIPKKLAVGN
jgi:hypothetical protein